MMRILINSTVLIMVLFVAPASRGEQDITWDSLNAETRQLLQGLEGSWDQFSP